MIVVRRPPAGRRQDPLFSGFDRERFRDKVRRLAGRSAQDIQSTTALSDSGLSTESFSDRKLAIIPVGSVLDRLVNWTEYSSAGKFL